MADLSPEGVHRTAAVVRTWRLTHDPVAGRWAVAWWHEDGADPVICTLLPGGDAPAAQAAAAEWLRGQGETVLQWLPGQGCWIALTAPPCQAAPS